MRALLRYAILKTSREQLLPGLLLAPAVIFLAPLLLIAVHNAVRGQTVYPMTVDARLGARGSAAMMMEVVLFVSALMSGIAAFRMFQSEVKSKAVGAFYLATPPRTVALGTMIYGAMVGTGAYVIGLGVISVLTASWPPDVGRGLTIAVIAATFTSALGSLTLAISDDVTMLVPVCAGGVAVAVALKTFHGATALGAAIVGILVVVAIAEIVWRRRCVV